MNKNVLSLMGAAFLTSSLYGHTYAITDGLQQIDSVGNIEDMSIFDNSCVDYVLARDAQSGEFELHTANNTDYTYNASVLNSLEAGEKFVVKATGTCSIVAPDIGGQTVVHNGITYKTIVSPKTGRIWLDRNLGASRVCLSSTDSSCFGDYYQWGRDTDGHEKDIVSTTTTKKSRIDNVGRYFVKGSSDWTTADRNGDLRSAKWSKTDGTSICPAGYRVPTSQEFSNENDYLHTAFDLFLKLPHAGTRDAYDAVIRNVGYISDTWTSTNSSGSAYNFYYLQNSSFGSSGTSSRSYGRNVRCIQD